MWGQGGLSGNAHKVVYEAPHDVWRGYGGCLIVEFVPEHAVVAPTIRVVTSASLVKGDSDGAG